MNEDNKQNTYKSNKIKNFKLNIPDGDFYDSDNTELYSNDNEKDDMDDCDVVIHSYSNPHAAKKAKITQNETAARAERAHEIRNLKKGKKNKTFFKFIWVIMVLFCTVLLSQFFITGINDMLGVGKEEASITVEIPKNATTGQIADILNKAGAIRDVNFFQFYSKLTKADGHYNNGSYKIDTNMDYEAIINSLQSNANRVDTIKITFKEGINILDVSALLEKDGVCTAEKFLSAINSNDYENYEIIKAITNDDERYYKLEGYLFPDTYEFYKDEDPKTVIKKFLSNCNNKITKEIKTEAEEKNMTIDQLLTLASMIQAEAADKEDMLKVSSVFHNRLNSGGLGDLKRLRSDPTMYYPYRTKASIPADLQGSFKSRYDTYTVEGLPPGPICNPGLDAINAALEPEKTNYYYFCHDKNSKSYYATNIVQHNINLKKAGLK
jgi:UPF0755 protein